MQEKVQSLWHQQPAYRYIAQRRVICIHHMLPGNCSQYRIRAIQNVWTGGLELFALSLCELWKLRPILSILKVWGSNSE